MDLPTPASPAPPLSPAERRRAFWDMWLVDHGFIRDIYANRHPVAPGVWRSAQPAPHHLEAAKALGVRTVLNLRGRRDTCGSYILERDACEHLGLTLIDFPIRSRGALERETLLAAAAIFDTLDYPLLMHCKSGADRAGFMATLYLFLREGRDLGQAMRIHLSLRYGHVRHAKTGIIDRFFATFLAETDGRPASFVPWVRDAYDPLKLEAGFRENRLAALIVNRILRRE